MKRLMVRVLFMILDVLGINLVFRAINAGKLRVLMYHGVTAQAPPAFCWTQLPLRQFATQMRILKKHYDVISAESLVAEDSGQITCAQQPVVITFDDGYENVLSEASKVLMDLNLPATVFVVTGLSQSGQIIWTDIVFSVFITYFHKEIDLTRFGLEVYPKRRDRRLRVGDIEYLKNTLKSYSDEDRRAVVDHLLAEYPLQDADYSETLRLMSAEQIKELSQTGKIHIASHSHHHPILSTLSPAEQSREIELSLSVLDSWQLPRSRIFAYPNGRSRDYNDHTISALKGAGILAAVTTDDGFYNPADGPYRVKRIPIGAGMDRWEFKARLSGAYYFLRKLTGRHCP